MNVLKRNQQRYVDQRIEEIDKELQELSDFIHSNTLHGHGLNAKFDAQKLVSARTELENFCKAFNLKYKPLKNIPYVTNQRSFSYVQREPRG